MTNVIFGLVSALFGAFIQGSSSISVFGELISALLTLLYIQLGLLLAVLAFINIFQRLNDLGLTRLLSLMAKIHKNNLSKGFDISKQPNVKAI